MKKKIFIFVILIGMVFTMSSCKNTTSLDNGNTSVDNTGETSNENLLSGKIKAEITMKGKKTKIELELDADTAPITVTNFVKLAEDGFYDGLTFHRIIKGFMIQGGDPEGTGMGGSDETIKGEFKNNGIANNISHKRGVISMARSAHKDSASSQFFIMHKDTPSLDGDYAAFGHVTKGMSVVDEIAEKTPVTDDNGTVEKKNQPVIKSIKIIRDKSADESKEKEAN